MLAETHHQVFFRNLPAELIGQTVEAVQEAYRLADKFFEEEFPDPERRNGIGDLRKLYVDREVRALFNAFPADTSGDTSLTRRKTAAYTVLRASDGLVLTLSTTQSPGQLPQRKTRYNEDLAASNQYELISEFDTGKTVFAIITHGTHEISSSEPDWVRVVFPDPTLSHHISSPIDLLDLNVSSMATEEEITDQATATPKETQKEETGTA